MLSSSWRASGAASTGVLPVRTTETAGGVESRRSDRALSKFAKSGPKSYKALDLKAVQRGLRVHHQGTTEMMAKHPAHRLVSMYDKGCFHTFNEEGQGASDHCYLGPVRL